MINKTWLRHIAAGIALLVSLPASAQLIISEFRVRGANGANDEFIEIYNNSGAAHTVAGGGTGYAVAASDGVARCVIPNGTVIPNRGHYLCVNSLGYSLASYPAGNGTTATGDATYTTDIPDNAGIAIFNTSIAANFNLANRMDAVGSTAEANTLYKEGTGYPALAPFSINAAFVRDECGKGGAIVTTGPCSLTGPKDTNNNAADFIFVDTNGTSAGAGQRLGAPGPQNLSSPIAGTTGLAAADLDSCAATSSPPNRVRDFTSDPPNNSTFGTLDIRQTFTNTSGGNLTRLRFRVVDLTTFPAPSGIADLRPRTSTAVVVTVDRPPCGSGTSNITVQGTTLEQPPSQPNGGGFNSSMSVGTVTLGTPLANGATVDVRFLLGIQQTGYFKFGIVPETLPAAGFGPMVIEGCTDGACPPPTVTINQAAAQADPTNTGPINFTATFNTAVTGFTASDVTLSGTAGATTATVTGGPTVYNVAVSGMTSSGTVIATIAAGVANDSTTNVPNAASTSTDNTVTFDNVAPSVVVSIPGSQPNPAPTSPVHFTVTFSESVAGFTTGDVVIGGTSGATSAVVSGGPAVYDVAVSGMTSNGSVTISVPAGVATDLAGNPNTASTGPAGPISFVGFGPPAPVLPAPSLTWPMLIVLAALLVGIIARRPRVQRR